ncbi:MAG: glycosyltransferase [Bryobacteraceae bacterium]|nr:glycosyltransferase [Bryobacteraceae bacterium]
MRVKLAFVSCREQYTAGYLDRLRTLYPSLPLLVVSEFPPPDGQWIPFHPRRTFGENLARIRAALAGRRPRLCAVVLDAGAPYGSMRWMALLLSPAGFIAFNENLDNFMLRPGSAGTIARHLKWRLKGWVRFQIRPGGTLYTWAWRVRHPSALRRPLSYLAGRVAGAAGGLIRRVVPAKADPAPEALPEGISVVVPTRNGKDLVARLLPGVLPQLPPASEVIVVDNGSDDGTAAFLAASFPAVKVEVSAEPLSFAAAVNRGIARAGYSHVCLLNNDMIVEADFFRALRRAFDQVPELFCATAQIFFPLGMRRQETGKAVWWSKEEKRGASDFPVRCVEPIEGEDLTYVLYGSGGCSMFPVARLRQMGGFDELLAPAYVEDLDLGWRGWQRNWPTVFVAGARVTHFHRSTTSRYYKPDLLQSFVEYNFLRFVARRVAAPDVFGAMWKDALDRLNRLAVEQPYFVKWPEAALGFAWKATRLLKPAPEPLWPERWILGIGSGAVAVFPGRAERGRARVLVVSPYLPFPLSHGGAVRMFNLMRAAAEGFDQVLVAFVDELAAPPAQLLDLCVEIVLVKRYGTHLFEDKGRPDVVEEFSSPAMEAALRQSVRKWRPGVAQLEFTQMAQYTGDCAPARTILVEHDVTYDLYQQLLDKGEDWETRRQLARWRRFEKQAWRDVDRVAVMSQRDAAEVEGQVGPKAVCLPNGVDLERFRPSGKEKEERGRLLFIGSFQHLPNMLAVEFFLRECWGRLAGCDPRLHLIAGNRHSYFAQRYAESVKLDLEQPGIEVEGFVADVRPAYERASIVLAPLVASAGTNIKIMEAMAMGKAVVSTPAGINGLDLAPGRDVVVATSGEQMVEEIKRLLEDGEERRRLGERARERVARDFGWEQIGRRQAELYFSLIDQ